MKLAYLTHDVSTLLLLLVLIIAAVTDLYHHRLPNPLTLGALLLALALQLYFLQGSGLLQGLAGAFTGLLLLLPFYLLGGMGAGDVKLMAAVGGFIGPLPVALAAAFSLICAGLYGLALITVKREWTPTLQRYLVSLRNRHYLKPEPDQAAAQRFPFALAIAAGTLLTLYWYGQLAFYHLGLQIAYQLQVLGITS